VAGVFALLGMSGALCVFVYDALNHKGALRVVASLFADGMPEVRGDGLGDVRIKRST